MRNRTSELQNLLRNLPAEMQAIESSLQKSYNGLQRSIATAGKTSKLREMQEIRHMNRTAKMAQDLQKKLSRAASQSDKNRILAEYKQRFEHEDKIAEMRLKAHEEVATQMDSDLEEYIKKYQSGLLEGAENAAEALGEGFENLQNNLKNLDIKGLGGMMKGGGKGLQNMGGAMGGGMGKMVAGLGKAVQAIGAAVAVFGVFAAVMKQADDAAKEMNSTILDGVSVFDLGVTKAGQLGTTLYDMRQMSYSLGNEFRLQGQEVAGLANAFLQAGMTMDDFGRFADTGRHGMVGMQDTMREVLRTSRLLGMDANELAQTYTQMNEDFGMDMEQIGNAFRDIYTAANLSSIGTQKFMGMITQATGNLALFNIDFSEASALAAEFIETLGEEGASQMLSNLAGKFGKMGYEERKRMDLLSGGGLGRGVRAGMNAQAAALESGAGGAKIQKALSQMGFGGQGLADALMKMNAQQQRELVNTAKNLGLGDEMSRKLSQVSFQANALQTDATKGTKGMDLGSTLAVMQEVANNFGGGDIRKAAFTNMAALENVTGMQGEELDNYMQMIDSMRGQYEDLQRIQKVGIDQAAAERGMSTADLEKLIQENYRVTMKDGKITNSVTGQEVGGFTDYLAQMSIYQEDTNKALSLEQQLAQEAVEETRSLSAIMENTIAGLLDSIYQSLSSLVSITLDGIFGRSEENKQAVEAYKAEREEAVAAMVERQNEISDERNKIKKAATGRDLNVAEQKTLKEFEREEKELKKKIKLNRYMAASADRLSLEGVDASTKEGVKEKVIQSGDVYARANAYGLDTVSAEEVLRYSAPEGFLENASALAGDFLTMGGNTRDRYAYARQAAAEQSGFENLPKQSRGIEFHKKEEEERQARAATAKFEEEQKKVQETIKEKTEAGVDATTAVEQAVRESALNDQIFESASLGGVKGNKLSDAITNEMSGKDAKAVDKLVQGRKTTVEQLDTTEGSSGRAEAERYNRMVDRLYSAGYLSDTSLKVPVDDFIYRGGAMGGTITPIHTQDQFLGMKPNGPVDKAMGGGVTVVVNIQGDANASTINRLTSAITSPKVLDKLKGKRRK